jgi:hypothetical protein
MKKGCLAMIYLHPGFSFPALDIQVLEEVLYDLPPLEGIFLHWHTHGVTATTASMRSFFARREQLLGPTTLSGASVQLLYECATNSLHRFPEQDLPLSWHHRPLHVRLLRHEPAFSAAVTQIPLPPGVLAQKTVLMTVGGISFVYTGVGPQRLTRQHLHSLAVALDLPCQVIKQCSINSLTFNSVETLGMHPGIISSFWHPLRPTGLTALILVLWPKQWEEQALAVAIALSLWESLVLPLHCLHQLIRSYAKQAYPEVRIIELESEGTLYAQSEQRIG